MAVEADGGIGADCVANRLRRLGNPADRFGVVQRPAWNRQTELERGVAVRLRLLRLVADDGGIGRSAAPAVGIDADLVADRAAQQLPDRFAERFAEDVPTGEFDSRNGGGLDHAALPEALADQHLHEVADPGWILPDDQIFEIAQCAEDGVVVAFERRFAEAGEPFVGVDENVEVVPVGE